MKAQIHPEVYNVVFLDTSSGAQFMTTSTIKSDETTKINGKEYYVIKVEISSDSHPFYTGKQKLLDTSGRLEKFQAKRKLAEDMAAKAAAEAKAKAGDDDSDEAETEAETETAEEEVASTDSEE
ncbi:50S ribosomal protein L31 type B [Candidatus Peregrinibacteria bacterium HGW-Peregrinibacteria-1]|jgi:large subunit ribosomal protein L31|nr:MAG: 50S ribosomal protein L31 type B [Candidatus Peregrinibacteria bacterium HGW-Peregrinibacteria-1]